MDLIITAQDRDSALWKKQEVFLKERLGNFSQSLERRNLPQVDAEYLRGQIALIREILNAGDANEN